MGKFDGILLASDLDGTLLNSSSDISDENISAIKYFKDNGGKFMFLTGRTPQGSQRLADKASPNMPCVVFNGTGVYNYKNKKHLWGMYLDDGAKDVIKLVTKEIQGTGVVIPADEQVFFANENEWVKLYYKVTATENMVRSDIDEISVQMKKAIFIDSGENIARIREIIKNSEYSEKYTYVQTNSFLYEILPKNVSKVTALKVILKDYDFKKIIAVGDGENDIEAIKFADVGIAAGNAMQIVKENADFITVGNDEHIILNIVKDLESGRI